MRDLDITDDPRGRLIESDAMAIFVPDELDVTQAVKAYNDVYDTKSPSTLQYVTQDFTASPQRIAFAPPAAGGHANLDTLSLRFAAASVSADPTGTTLSVLPVIAQARVRLSDVQQVASLPKGVDAVDIAYYSGYLDAVDPTAEDPAGVFARLVGPDGNPQAVAMTFAGPNGSGLATPDMGITGLSRTLGPVGGDLAKLMVPEAARKFDPLEYFAGAAPTLFGGIKLTDLLAAVEGRDALDAAPKLVTTRSATRVDISYDWIPHVQSWSSDLLVLKFATDSGQPMGVKGPLRLQSTLSLQPSTDPASKVIATLENFSIGFAGLITVAFRKLTLIQRSGNKPEVTLTLAPDSPLTLGRKIDFLQALLDFAKDLLGNGPSLDIANGVVKVGYAMAIPGLSIGVFNLQNIRLGVGLAIPLGGDPLALSFNFGEKDHHFLLAVAFIGGGGFFAIEVDAHGPRSIELAVEVAASVALDLGVASGSAHVAVGVYFHYTDNNTEISGFVRAGGELTVLAILSLHVELYLGLTYQAQEARKVIWGEASLMVEVSIGCLSKSVTLSMRREFVVADGAKKPMASPALLTTTAAITDQAFGNSREEWQTYFAAFA
jgi:hypothetical protein